LFLEYDAIKDIPPYLTYKSIDRIKNYESNGQNLEWIIFEPQIIKESKKLFGLDTKYEKEIKLIRIVDDLNDYTFKVDGDNYTLIDDLTFEHPFGEVPGLINSDIQRLGTLKRFSIIDNIIPLEKEYLRDQSVLTIYKFLNGFATPIRPVVVCPACRGIGKKGIDDCSDCDGKGHVLRNDVTDEIQIPISLDKEEGYNLPTGIFTYMTPPLEIWDQYNTELIKLSNASEDTLWGTHKERFENERTAFETFIDTQPVTTKLSTISEVAEFMEWQFTEWIANYVDLTKDKKESISIISYGKMFIIEPSESIIERYRINKENGVSVVILDRQLTEYITAKYKNNPETLFDELVKKELDYYIHYTIEQVSKIFGNVEAQKKILFTDWWETLSQEDIRKDINILKTERDDWIKTELEKLNINQNTGNNE
ncbi:MAG: hypothetical protein GY870_21910, partial [archaeon]|nr:hypothetical protein [archaeon]